MFQRIKMIAIAGSIITAAAVAQPVRADHIGLSVGMGVNMRQRTITIVNPSPVVYAVPDFGGAAYASPAYGYGGYGYSSPACSVPLYSQAFTGPSFGAEQTFYQPNFYYGGGYYQTGGVSASPYFFGGRFYGGGNFYGGGFYGGGVAAIPSASYRTAPVWAGPRYNGAPSRLTFGPLSRW